MVMKGDLLDLMGSKPGPNKKNKRWTRGKNKND